MTKKLLLSLFLPIIGFSQVNETPNQEKSISKALKSAYHLANQVNEMSNTINNKVLKPVLDSSVNYEIYTDPDELYKFYKNRYVYDATGRNTSSYIWVYDFQDDTLGKTFYTYNANNKLVSSISYSNWDGWEFDSKKQYIYTNDKLTQIIDSTYNTTTSAFRLYMTLDYTYDANNLITEIFADLAEFNGTTYGKQKIIFDYNLDNKLIYETILFENTLTTLYEDRGTYDFQYVGQNNSSTVKERFDLNTSAFVSDGRNDYYYNTAVNKSELVLPIEQIYGTFFQIIPEVSIGNYANKLDSLHEFSSSLELSAKMIFYYNQKDIVGLNNLKNEKINFYPNPSTGVLSFTNLKGNYSIKIMDVFGKTILNTQTNVSKIDLNSFANGLYTILIQDENNSTILKEKLLLNK